MGECERSVFWKFPSSHCSFAAGEPSYNIRFLCCCWVRACEQGVLQLLTSSAKHRKSIAVRRMHKRAERDNLQLGLKTSNAQFRQPRAPTCVCDFGCALGSIVLLLPISSESAGCHQQNTHKSVTAQSLFLKTQSERARTFVLGVFPAKRIFNEKQCTNIIEYLAAKGKRPNKILRENFAECRLLNDCTTLTISVMVCPIFFQEGVIVYIILRRFWNFLVSL